MYIRPGRVGETDVLELDVSLDEVGLVTGLGVAVDLWFLSRQMAVMFRLSPGLWFDHSWIKNHILIVTSNRQWEEAC